MYVPLGEVTADTLDGVFSLQANAGATRVLGDYADNDTRNRDDLVLVIEIRSNVVGCIIFLELGGGHFQDDGHIRDLLFDSLVTGAGNERQTGYYKHEQGEGLRHPRPVCGELADHVSLPCVDCRADYRLQADSPTVSRSRHVVILSSALRTWALINFVNRLTSPSISSGVPERSSDATSIVFPACLML